MMAKIDAVKAGRVRLHLKSFLPEYGICLALIGATVTTIDGEIVSGIELSRRDSADLGRRLLKMTTKKGRGT